jgi:omega-6 fatty acid desaturase (delta-12 desaturase)
LQRAHDENPIFHAAPVMTIRSGVRALMLTLYDEQERQMIRFKDLRRKS